MVGRRLSSSAFIAWSELYPGAALPMICADAVEVVAHGEFGAGPRFELRQRGERNHLAVGVADIELADILWSLR